jgi:hypothetical protein
MSDRLFTHDATDWIRTLEELKSTATRAPRLHGDTLGGEAETNASANSPQSGSLDLGTRIERALRATGYPPLRNVHILAAEGIAILRGTVPTYYMKQIAQAAVSGVPGVIDVHNELDVVPLDAFRNAGPT